MKKIKSTLLFMLMFCFIGVACADSDEPVSAESLLKIFNYEKAYRISVSHDIDRDNCRWSVAIKGCRCSDNIAVFECNRNLEEAIKSAIEDFDKIKCD